MLKSMHRFRPILHHQIHPCNIWQWPRMHKDILICLVMVFLKLMLFRKFQCFSRYADNCLVAITAQVQVQIVLYILSINAEVIFFSHFYIRALARILKAGVWDSHILKKLASSVKKVCIMSTRPCILNPCKPHFI